MISQIILKQFRRSFSTVAVVMSGCGRADGSEITEAVSMFISLSKHNVKYQVYAPNEDQHHVIDHSTGEPMDGNRNIMVETSRIARDGVNDIITLDHNKYDAVFFPGGFGVAKNLSDFAFNGETMKVHPQVSRILKEFNAADKYIALVCIAPILGASVFGTKSGGQGVSLTLGSKGKAWPFESAIDVAESFGNHMKQRGGKEIHVDEVNKMISTPAYMCETNTAFDVFSGIDSLVQSVVKRIK